MKLYTFLVVGALLAIAISCKTATPKGVTAVSLEELDDVLLIEDIQLIDVRTPIETEDGIITNAKNISYDSEFSTKLLGLDKIKPIIVYCKSGGRSAKASKILLEQGFVEIYDLKGGYDNYKKNKVQ